MANTTSKTTTSTVGKNISSLPTSTIQKAVGATVDNSYGPQTTAAVKTFQQANGLVADGIVGPKTQAAITASMSGGSSSTSSSGGGSSSSGKTATFGDQGQYTYNVDSKGIPYGSPIITNQQNIVQSTATQNAKNNATGAQIDNTIQNVTGVYGTPVKDQSGKVIGYEQYDTKTGKPLQKPTETPVPEGNVKDVNGNTYNSSMPKDMTYKLPEVSAVGNKWVFDTNGKAYEMDIAGTVKSNPIADEMYNANQEDSKVKQEYNDLWDTRKAGLDASYVELIDSIKQEAEMQKVQQADLNTRYLGAKRIAGFRTGGTEYTPEIAMGILKNEEEQGLARIADIDMKSKLLIAQAKSAHEDKQFEVAQKKLDTYQALQKEKKAEIESIYKSYMDNRKYMSDALAELNKPIQELAKSAANGGAPTEVVQSILNSKTLGDAYTNAGGYASGGTGIIGEYNFYKAQALANNQTPVSFNSYQDMDANRKKSIAAAGVSSASGMNSKEVTIFNSLVDKQNKSPLIAANDRAVILKDITSELKTDPTNAALQVSFIYSMIQALDTYQSAVREGEIGLLSSTQGVGDKLQNLLPKLEKGTPLSENKIKEYLSVATTLTNSIESAATNKRNAFSKQAEVAGIGPQFKEYQDSVYGEVGTSKNLIQTENQAKAQIEKIYPTASDELANSIDSLFEKGYNNLKVFEYLQAKGQIQ